ncbi:MAG TPA: GTPase, partial [Clostridiales bacterium]|nr:GTPase [Clostridiales bacterium]
MKKLPEETPVYLFMGFLESGKTKFIQETLEDKRFYAGEKTLLLVTEEGEEEYDPSRFVVKDVTMRVVSKEEMTVENLTKMQLEADADRVLVEYNGMWTLDVLFDAMPEGWFLTQVMTFFDTKTFLSYNANMRQLTFDKIKNTQMVVFNRFPADTPKDEYHKAVRAITRQADIVYEHTDGKAEYDDTVDPMPYDMNAPVIEIADKDYALFYRDLSENMDVYIGKTVKFKGLVVSDKRLPENSIVIGRHIMTCCEADIQYSGLACVMKRPIALKTRD